MITAEDYFSNFETEVATPEDLSERVSQVEALAHASGLIFYWRGQGDASWGVHSSLHRSVGDRNGAAIEDVSEADVLAIEGEIVRESREWIRPSVGARLTTVDLFARLQHHGIPTRLLDFSGDPWVALYFACVEHPCVDGRIVVAAARRTPSEEFRNAFNIPWNRNVVTRPVDWSSSLYLLADHDDFLRITRQKGVFVVGGTPSTQPQRRLSGISLGARDVRRSMSLPLALHSWSQAEAAVTGALVRGRQPTVASALSIRIPAGSKIDLLRILERKGYSYTSLFPDIQGLRDYGRVVSALYH